MYTTISNLVQTAVEFGRTYWLAILLGLLALLTAYGMFMKYWFKPGKMNLLKFVWYYRQWPIRYGHHAKKIQLVHIEQVLEELATDYNHADLGEQAISHPYDLGKDHSNLNPRRDLRASKKAHTLVYRRRNAFWNAQNAGKAYGYKLKDAYKSYVRGAKATTEPSAFEAWDNA